MYKLYIKAGAGHTLIAESSGIDQLKAKAKSHSESSREQRRYRIADHTGRVVYESQQSHSWRMRWKAPLRLHIINHDGKAVA